MIRNLLDDYLDDTLAADERANLQRRLLAEPHLAQLLANLQSERALRAAAIASFEPAPHEARALAAKALNAMTNSTTHSSRPAGYVGTWFRRSAAVAAALAIVAGSFALGRNSTPPAKPVAIAPTQKTDAPVVYSVVYVADSGEKQLRQFTTLDDQNAFINKLDSTRTQPQIATADLSSPGSF